MATRRKVGKGGLRVRAYPVLRQAVEAGVAYGWRRAYKYVDNPTESAVRDCIEEAVMGQICEAFEFDEED